MSGCELKAGGGAMTADANDGAVALAVVYAYLITSTTAVAGNQVGLLNDITLIVHPVAPQ